MMLIDQIRKYAIHKLSTDFVLSPIEKICFARAHKVAAWLDEVFTWLVNGNSGATLDNLATLGWETDARILWIRDKIPRNTLHFRRDEIRCGSCSSSASLINGGCNCHYCGKDMPADAELTVPDPGRVSGPTDHLPVPLRAILCNDIDCRQPIFYSISIRCSSCSFLHDRNDNVRIMRPKKGLKELIEEMFGDEIRNYEVA
jgi:hypothetical protein